MTRSWTRCVLSLLFLISDRVDVHADDSDRQVDAFLEAHDSGLTDADKRVANGKSFFDPSIS